MRAIVLLGLFLAMVGEVQAQSDTYPFQGKVRDDISGESLQGALIKVKDSETYAISDRDGVFTLHLEAGIHTIVTSYLGYDSLLRSVSIPEQLEEEFKLIPSGLSMGEIEVVSTGYQKLPKERATGSFVKVDRELVNRRVSTNLMDRLEDVTSGLIFNRTGPASDAISIRGRNTLFANTQPLIVIDNFPYDGPLESINPNDVESITVLRDAAAASIWGARAGNGVIVITTKKGGVSAPRVSFNSNVNLIEKPDLFYEPIMSNEDRIWAERTLFERGSFLSLENSVNRPVLSPVLETFIAERNGLIDAAESNARLEGYRNQDIRRDFMEHFYRPQLNQQHSLSVSGGTKVHRYNYSLGMDRNNENLQANSNERVTIGAQNQWKLLGDKLDVNANLYFTKINRDVRTEMPREYYQFESLTDQMGNPMPIIHRYNQRFVNSEIVEDLLDWRYIPLNELGRHRNTNEQDDYRINLSLGYQFLPGLKGEILYQYWQNKTVGNNLRSSDLFFTRDLINQFTQVGSDGSIERPIPEGDILDLSIASAYSHSFRGQLNYNKEWESGHELHLLGGYELKDLQAERNSMRYYGYNDQLAISRPVDHVTRFRLFHNGLQSNISSNILHAGNIDRFVSYYFNGGYSFSKKYNLSISARRDASNIFGVDTNQKGVPLWSAGAGWVISGEDFYNSGLLPYLKFRTSYGVNGNIDKSLSALTTVQYYTNWQFDIPAGELGGQIINPANPMLRWEQIRIWNLGADFESRNGRISGSLEYYSKNGVDLIGDAPLPPSTGLVRFRGNTSGTIGKGLDLDLQTRNLTGALKWNTNFLYSHISEKVTDYFYQGSVLNYLAQSDGVMVPLEGRPLFAIYSLPWAGLDPDNGNPLGYVDGEVSSNYSAIFNNTSPETLKYHGPRRPTSFGSLRNTFSYGGFSLSFNISYRLGYFYRRESINYATVFAGNGGHADFAQRWQQPGDELFTSVPSLPLTNNNLRNNFYRYAEHLVERGDHVRLQDIRLSYLFERSRFPGLPFQNAEVYTYANNLGILWKASNDPLDPDFRSMRPLTSIAAGIRIDF
ncbi:SusC/RagA family TonB-linked outer membrane protein [Litoribacter populi]|uniref:SusC/RagA family TonB-linked outer membrane protein n=1 Tax=Litoribacter populi TaxID=2598460 RepID=UPI001180A98E|nr:SusC/RagA family TonB-linked outer membrane protein [Litoribacter populi]